MASGATAPPIAMANPPHSLLDQDTSTVSSPLSEVVEDKDTEHMDVDIKSNPSDDDEPEQIENGQAGESAANEDSESLSEIDSEASTERLYDTPRKGNGQLNNTASNPDYQKEPQTDKVLRSFNRSPTKLQEQLQASAGMASGDDDNEDLSEASVGESEADSDKDTGKSQRSSRSLHLKTRQSHVVASDEPSTESRKRKRPAPVGQSSDNEHPRKRANSVIEPSDAVSSLSKVLSEELGRANSTGGKSAEQSGAENDDTIIKEDADTIAESVEKPTNELLTRSRKSRRSTPKRWKTSADEAPVETHETEEPAAENGQPPEDEPIETAEVDEEAEIAHKNEEELERKRHAFDQLGTIEKQFAVLRDRLYEERLAQLNEEQALLEGDNPTHPEYLAMMQCIDSRRDDKVRVTEIEYQYNMDALDRWAVARRAQILSQFYQSVRESREKTLDELGKQWYEIQHERRKNANPIPDYGFRFPKTKALQKKQAIAHSKETSILAGVAQHHGFPAAPEMKAASRAEIEDDFEAMHPTLNEYGAVPFGRTLGPAGEQFLEQTPWANPKHPSHGSRRHSHDPETGHARKVAEARHI
ncbi:hypothetical protein M406DRAFT_340389 [Cryphonectria parasitica EP155]|uniref:Transcriptional regulatory protein DEP1 n=1 Tax=Cryphonectria parasitica (strain ATCC 38755 / EP155) TaxID=660469 RepID=A0A9P5CP00_CRYP1|nr:uncharacterized protein M406DRAFT_340389 [Cryphonectria parasitica EP155]KAF3764867.1 hypothetical protein M406DRAFT_340389 [Cryphonectria parasitica EP155]